MCERGWEHACCCPTWCTASGEMKDFCNQWISLVMNLVDCYIVAQLYINGVGCQEELLANSKPVAKCHLKR